MPLEEVELAFFNVVLIKVLLNNKDTKFLVKY